ncbi:hypothetical protein MD484_g5634, partial [Candolleomyces efflorescens]
MATWGVGQNDPSHETLALREKLSSKETAIASYETQLLRRNNDYDELKKLHDETVNKLRAESERAVQLESDLQQCREDLRDQKLNVQNIQATLTTTQQKFKSADLGTRDLEATLESLSRESTTHQERCKSLERDKGKLEERVRELQNLLSQTPSSSTSKRKQSHRPRSSSLSNFRITTLESDIGELRTTLQQREKELETVTKKLAAVQGEANRVGNERNVLEKRMTSRLAELEGELAEREVELNYLRGNAGGDREQELLDRIDEDEAKMAALESIIRNTPHMDELEKKWKQAESKLQEEGRRTQKLVQQLLQLKEERESLLLELNAARSDLANQGPHRRLSTANGALDTSMDGCDPMADDAADTTLPLPDEGTVEYIERLLAAIDRLRAERDDLRRDVQFLESESRFAIEALEAKLSASMATTSAGTTETARTMGQMKLEMDALHEHLEDMQSSYDLEMRQKNQELHRLSRALAALGVVVGQGACGHHATNRDGPPEPAHQADREHLKELEGKLEDAMLSLDAMTNERDDLADALRKKETPWDDEVQTMRFSQQESNRTIQDLSSQIDDLTKTVERVESERSSLVLQVTNLEDDLQKAQDELAEAERRYSALQFHQLSSMSSSEATQSLRQQIKELEMRVMRRTEQVGIHQHDIRRLETNIRLQEERLGEMTVELEMMTAEKAAMVEDCADAREVRDDALRRVEEMEEAMEALESSMEQSDSTVVSMVAVLFDTVAKARRARQTLTSSVSLNEQLHDAFDHIDELKEQNGHLEHAMQKYNERINQLTSQIVSLEGTVATTDALKSNFDAQSAALQDEMDSLREAKESMEEAHSIATRELEMELERLRHRIRDLEYGVLQRSSEANLLQQSKDRNSEELRSQVSSLEAALADAESSYRSRLQEYDDAMKSLTESKRQAEEELTAVRDELGLAEVERNKACGALESELMEERQSREQAQQSFNQLEQDRHRLVSELDQLHKALEAARDDLDAEKHRFSELEEKNIQESDNLKDQIHELSTRLEEEQQSRLSEGHNHESAFSTYKQQQDMVVTELQQDLERLKQELDSIENLRLASEEEKTTLQQQMTDLVAKIEQNKSLQRHFEGQIQEREHSIEGLKSDICGIQAKLNAAEQANAKATLNLSLLTAQHKREMAEMQREVERLRSKSNLEQTIAELEERNQEMDQLLKQKCIEIEENDDRTLGHLKENKKLAAKVESLTRKVQTLQAKVATLKASSPKAEPKSGATSKTSPSADSSSRPRSVTLTSNQPCPAQTQNRPSTSNSRPLSRVASGPSMALRPKTPEVQLGPAPRRSKTPEKAKANASPVGETLSVAGKKRRAPDDFEVCDNMPPQAFTAESVPRNDIENRTPRVRRVLSSLQSGFTPVRNFARPVAPLPSPRRNPATVAAASPFIADLTNSPLNVLPPLTFAPPPPSASKSNKRSWLGKIRGAGPGISRPQ